MPEAQRGEGRSFGEELQQAWPQGWTPRADAFFTHEARCPLPGHNHGGTGRMLIRTVENGSPVLYCQQCGGGAAVLTRVARALGIPVGEYDMDTYPGVPGPASHPETPPSLTLLELYELPRWMGTDPRARRPEHVGPPGEVWVRIHSHPGGRCTTCDGMARRDHQIAWQGGMEFHRDRRGDVHRRLVLPWTTRRKVLEGDHPGHQPRAASYIFTANGQPAPPFFMLGLDPPESGAGGVAATEKVRAILDWAQSKRMPIELSQSGRGYHAVGLLDSQARQLLSSG